MKNCPNCGSPIEPYKCKCEYCGTWYFDFTSFDMTENVPYYVKFKTQYGIITTLAKPILNIVEVNNDYCYAVDSQGNVLNSFITERSCDLNVTFNVQPNPDDNTLFVLEVEEEIGDINE